MEILGFKLNFKLFHNSFWGMITEIFFTILLTGFVYGVTWLIFISLK